MTKTYREPSDEEIYAALQHTCEAAGHSEADCDLACPWCGVVTGFDGYCDDSDCPNYKGGKLAERLAKDQLFDETGEVSL